MRENPSLENLIQEAISKVNGKNETNICRFIPSRLSSGGYMHHFTLKKMKREHPEELYDLIQAYIIQIDQPQEISAKPPERPCTYIKKQLFTVTEAEMDRIIDLATRAQDLELLEIMRMKEALIVE